MNAINGLPFITINLFGKPAKILIDSGANKNFISPSFIPKDKQLKCKPLPIKNSSGKHVAEKKFVTTLFGLKQNVTFYLLKFHNFFDGLLGYESLSYFEALIDVNNHKLILPQKTIKMEIRRLGPPQITLTENSVQTIKLPVSQKKWRRVSTKRHQDKRCSYSFGLISSKRWNC